MDNFLAYVERMPRDEQESLLSSMRAARPLAAVMGLNGAKVGGGDVQHALAVLGLRLVSVDDPDLDRAYQAAQARLGAITETVPCGGCGREWMRMGDGYGVGAGWWHHGDDVNEECFLRKCPEGESAPRRR